MLRRTVLPVAVFASTLALAHGGLTHVMGTLTKATATSLEVNTVDGKHTAVTLTPATRWKRGTAAMQAGDVHPGDRVVIHARPENGGLTAVEVAVGAGKAAGTASSH